MPRYPLIPIPINQSIRSIVIWLYIFVFGTVNSNSVNTMESRYMKQCSAKYIYARNILLYVYSLFNTMRNMGIPRSISYYGYFEGIPQNIHIARASLA